MRIIFMLLLCCALACAGCGSDESTGRPAAERKLYLYSELEEDFSRELVRSFNESGRENHNKKNNNDKNNGGQSAPERLVVELVPTLAGEGRRADIILAEQRSLHAYKRQRLLQKLTLPAAEALPGKLRDAENFWWGVFYDPAVFLVNQGYARVIGQANLQGWTDLENSASLRLALENLSDNASTQNFLAALAEGMGETASLDYLWNLNRFVGQYAKSPFTSVRMTAAGDADVAITRRSYVFKYLENKFPAYVVLPKEGTPVNLYGAGMTVACTRPEDAAAFTTWLLGSAQSVALAQGTGYLFVFPRGLEEEPADAEKLWANAHYLDAPRQEALTRRWLERVRFSK